MDFLIFLIFFIAILSSVLGKKVGKQQGQRANQQRRQMQQQMQRPVYTQPQPPRQPQYQQSQPQYQQQTIFSQPVFTQPQPSEAQNILERAANNVREIQAEDTPAITPSASFHAMQQPKQVIQPSGELMKKVEDLIVTGYSGNLSFKRDFVAEGMDMLSRYEIR